MRNDVFILLRLELKIVNRYLRPPVIAVIFWVFYILWQMMSGRSQLVLQMNSSMILTIMVLSTGAMYAQDFFWGGLSEPAFRYIYHDEFKKMIFVKNLLISAMGIAILLPIYVVDLFLYHESYSQIINACLFYWMAMPVLLSAGNTFTLRNRSREKRGNGLTLLLQSGMVIVLAAVPYIIFQVIMDSIVGCVAVIFLGSMIWYMVSIPKTANQWYPRKSQILEGV